MATQRSESRLPRRRARKEKRVTIWLLQTPRDVSKPIILGLVLQVSSRQPQPKSKQ